MNDKSLSSLYRRLTASAPIGDADAGAAVDAVYGIGQPAHPIDPALVARLAESSRLADLARTLHALRPSSEALATAVRAADIQTDLSRGHRRIAARRSLSPRPGRRHTRWIASVAACLIVALFATQNRQAGMPSTGTPTSGADKSSLAVAGKDHDRIFTSEDRIFAATDEHAAGKQTRDRSGGDRLFRGSFSGG